MNYRQKKGNLLVVSAPSGAGKSTLCNKICETEPTIRQSVSYTTRKPRPGEVDGVQYSFIDEDEFRSMIIEGDFLEWAEVHGNFYGTSKKRIEDMMQQGIDVILDIDVQGAKQIRKIFPDSVLIFIMPPSMEELRQRLTGRESDAEDVIEKRLKNAHGEIKEYNHYDYVIVNDLIENALNDFRSIIAAERAKKSKINNDWIKEQFLKEDA
jgi:guanylate kinase